MLERTMEFFVENGMIRIRDTRRAAEDLNWLILAHHLNRAMFLGASSIPARTEIQDHAHRVVRFFLHAYGEA